MEGGWPDERQLVEATADAVLRAEVGAVRDGLYVRAGRLLSAEEEQALGRAVEAARRAGARLEGGARGRERVALRKVVANGEKARQILIEANMRLVVSIAQRFRVRAGDLTADIIQEGMFGLMRAVEGFDWERGLRFSTYASHWIKQAMVRAMERETETIRLGAGMEALVRQIAYLEEQTASRGGDRLDDATVAEMLEVSPEKVARVRNRPETTSLWRDGGAHGEEYDLAELVADKGAEDPLGVVLAQEQISGLLAALEKIGRREALVLRLRLGLEDGRARTLTEVAELLGVSKERVRQIEALGVALVRHPTFGLEVREAVGYG